MPQFQGNHLKNSWEYQLYGHFTFWEQDVSTRLYNVQGRGNHSVSATAVYIILRGGSLATADLCTFEGV